MSHAVIRQIYEARLKTWAETKSLRIAHQGVNFSPNNGETYLRAFTLPAGTDTATLAGDHRAYTGIFQVSVVTPSGSGPGRAEQLADEVGELYPAFLRLKRGSFEVLTLTPVEHSPAIVLDDTYTIAASFQYRADTL